MKKAAIAETFPGIKVPVTKTRPAKAARTKASTPRAQEIPKVNQVPVALATIRTDNSPPSRPASVASSSERTTYRLPESITYNRIAKFVTTAFSWINQKAAQQRGPRRLKVSETISLGEKRFVSILQVDGTQFLIGGTAATVSLLASLEDPSAFGEILQRESRPVAAQL